MSRPLISRVRNFLAYYYSEFGRLYYNTIWKTDIGKGSRVSRRARIDKTYPSGVHIGEYTTVTFDSVILTHDYVNNRHLDVYIGSYCFIGCGAVILPGVKIGDHCIIAANSLVVSDVPSNCVVVGNPAYVVEKGIKTGIWGQRIDKLEKQSKAT